MRIIEYILLYFKDIKKAKNLLHCLKFMFCSLPPASCPSLFSFSLYIPLSWPSISTLLNNIASLDKGQSCPPLCTQRISPRKRKGPRGDGNLKWQMLLRDRTGRGEKGIHNLVCLKRKFTYITLFADRSPSPH